jgi:hypothetical protein
VGNIFLPTCLAAPNYHQIIPFYRIPFYLSLAFGTTKMKIPSAWRHQPILSILIIAANKKGDKAE